MRRSDCSSSQAASSRIGSPGARIDHAARAIQTRLMSNIRAMPQAATERVARERATSRNIQPMPRAASSARNGARTSTLRTIITRWMAK